jgi:drug/metabolite transporter (DMT)-like permease
MLLSSLTLPPLAFGFAAGVCATLNITLLYHGFAVGVVGIVAPLEAVVGAAVPVVVGFATGERIPFLAIVGILCALSTPLLLVHRDANSEVGMHQKTTWSIILGLASGLCLGGVFVFLGKAGNAAGMAPLLAERVATVSLTGLVSTRLGFSRRPPVSAVKLAACGGVLDLIAHSLYFASTWRGKLSVVSVIYSLYPAGTIILARAVLKERLVHLQIVGVLFALCGMVLLVYGNLF